MTRYQLKDSVFLAIAEQLSQLGTCDRSAVGAVITREGRCVSWGFNGAPPGMAHCSENHHGWADDPDFIALGDRGPAMQVGFTYYKLSTLGCRNATHAEANALAFAARQGISTDGGTLYVTVSPCDTCAKLLIAAGIDRVVFTEMYRDTRGVSLLKSAGVKYFWAGDRDRLH